MSESNDKPPATGPQPFNPPPLPETFLFPTQLLERWLAIPPETYIKADLTRADLDLLLFGLIRSFNAQTSVQNAIINWSNGNIPAANQALDEARRIVIEGQNDIRKFFTSLMISATSK